MKYPGCCVVLLLPALALCAVSSSPRRFDTELAAPGGVVIEQRPAFEVADVAGDGLRFAEEWIEDADTGATDSEAGLLRIGLVAPGFPAAVPERVAERGAGLHEPIRF